MWPRLLPAGVAALEELYLLRGADGLLEDTLLAQKCLNGVILPHVALFYDLKKKAVSETS